METAIKEFFSEDKYTHIVTNCGVDWITLTGDTEKSKDKVRAMATALLDQGVESGNKLYKSSRNGYHVVTVEGIQWGVGSQGWMCILTGDTARRYWMSFYAYSKNCTRLDLQTTIAYRFYNDRLIQDVYATAKAYNEKSFAAHCTLIIGGVKGDTLYWGARASAQMGRIYDKAKQSKGSDRFDKCIRFEIEYKKPLSGQVAAWLCENSPDDKGITDKVLAWFYDRGIEGPPVYTYSDNAIQFPVKETGFDRKLSWLRTTVRSTYLQLKLAGFQTEADEALGVTEGIVTVNHYDEDKEL